MSRDIFSVEGSVVAVTGGMGQLGRQFASALAERGARVAVIDLNVNDRQVSEKFGPISASDHLIFLEANVTDRKSIESALLKIEQKWGTPHGLINNAALDSPPDAPDGENGPFEAYPDTSWEEVMKVNAKGPFLCSQVIGGQMAAAGRGSIVNISSIYGLVSPDQRIYEYRRQSGETFFKPVAYSVSKSALLNLTRYLATYWAEANVRVNTLTFGGVFNSQDEQFLRGYCAHVPLGRMAQQDEYNGAIIFLISDASSYMTGANLVIDGGWTAW
jgi:NAD(P)-dependent dehydrogenase (short-subunit alcohol dehydrogenase family)